MNDQFKSFPICINCKYFLPEKSGPMNIIQTCGLTMIDPVTGEFADRASRVKLAAAYRKENMPCGPSGKFFQQGKVKVTPKPKAKVEVEKVRPEAHTVEIDTPVMIDPAIVAKVIKEDVLEGLKEEAELLPLEPGAKRRKRRDK